MKKLITILVTLALATAFIGSVAAQDAGVTITVTNRGSSAWVVTGVEGASGVAETGTANPSLTLRSGVRYRIVVEADRSTHPFELVSTNGSDTVLLSQSANTTGSYEEDADVDFQEGSRGITFTMTSELLDELDAYRCGRHPGGMRGEVMTPQESAN